MPTRNINTNLNISGDVTATTQASSENSTKIATTAYVKSQSYLTTSGKAADADKLDGLDLHIGRNEHANKVVRTDGNGYIQAGWINTTSGNNGTTAISRIYASNDGYIRYYTPANFGAQIGSHISYNDLTNKPTIPSLSGYATEAHVSSEITSLIGGAPGALDTLNELAEAINDDASYASTITTALAGKLGSSEKAADSNLLDNIDSTRFIYGDNATGTSSISGSALNPTGHLKSGFYRVAGTSSTIPNATSNNFVLHTSYNSVGNKAGFDLAVNDSTTSKIYFRPATGGGRGSWQTIWTDASDGSGSGLDADKLDGLHASSFATSAQGTKADNALPKAGGTMNGKLILSDTGYSLGDEFHQWKRSYSVNSSGPKEILYSDGNSLPNGGVYRFTAHISGTGTDQFATAVYWNQNGTWKVNVTGQSGTSSNHPEFIISASTNKPTIHIDHGSAYTVHILGERIELSEGTGTDNAGYAFGTDAFLGSVGSSLYFNSGGTTATGVNPYDDGYKVFHDNYHPNADVLTTARTIAGTSFNGSANINISYNNLTNKPTIPTNNNQLTNGASYLTTSGKAYDSDRLDGINSSSFARSDAADSFSQRISFNNCDTNNHDTMATSTSSRGAFEIYNNGSGNDAFMAFHTGGDFAMYFGLDADNNKLSVGGWSMGAAKYEIYHSGNKPSLATLGYTGATNANNYSLPAGSSSTRGGFKIGYSENGKNYPVETSAEKMFVNVPWSDTNTNTTYSAGTGISLSGTTFSLTDTASKLSLAGGTVTGNLTVNGKTILGNALTDKAVVHGHLGIGEDAYPKIAYPGKNAQWSGSGTTTGQIVIDLPGTLANYDMMYMEIDIYEYSSVGATKLIIGGHNWNSGANSNTSTTQWYNVNVQVLGALNKPIYFGRRNDGSSERRCIAVGETNSSWSYGTVHVSKVSGASSFYTSAIDWVGDWNVDQTTSGSYFTKNPTTNFNSGNTLETNGNLSAAGGTFSGATNFTGGHGAVNITNSSILSSASSNWTGNPGGAGKIQYHSNRWYIVSDSSSNRIVQFRRNGTDTSYIDNSGNFVGNVQGNASTATLAANSTNAGGLAVGTGTNNSANQIVRTNSSGYADFGWINTTSGLTTGTITEFYVNTNDGYIRKSTPSHVRSQLNVADGANNYSLPAASSSTRGGVKIGYSENGKNYPVETSAEKMFVNVPWSDTNTNTTYSAGAGLFLSGTTFTHNDTSSQSSVNNSSGTVIQDITLDTYGHITSLGSTNLDSRYYTESESDSLYLRKSGGTMSGNTVVNNYGISDVGLYSATKYQGVWSMGTSYVLPASGANTGSLYGLAWTHTNIGGQSKSGLSHQLLVMHNGTTKSAIGAGIWTSGTITANNGNIVLGGTGRIQGVDTVSSSTDAANKAYVDNGLATKQASGTYNTIIGTDSDINTSGATVVDQLNMTDGVIQSHSTRTLTLANLGYTGATNANYITNNNQLSNGAGYVTTDTNTTYSAGRGLDLSGTQFQLETDLRDSISYLGYDSNDYIQFSNNSYFRSVVNGTERFRVNNYGSFGIGTSGPTHRLNVSGPNTSPNLQSSTVTSASLHLANSDNAYGMYFACLSNGRGIIQQRRQTSTTKYDLLLQPYGGRVAIGRTSASTALHVNGTITNSVYNASNLPSASPAGQRAFAYSYYPLATSHGSVVSTNGSYVIPVYSDGSSWRAG